MTPEQTLTLVRFAAAACPQQAIDEYTPDAWHELLADLQYDDCRAAVVSLGRRQAFMAPAEIRAEVRRIRDDRISRTVLPAPDPALADAPREYQAALQAGIHRVASALDIGRALGAGGADDAVARR